LYRDSSDSSQIANFNNVVLLLIVQMSMSNMRLRTDFVVYIH